MREVPGYAFRVKQGVDIQERMFALSKGGESNSVVCGLSVIEIVVGVTVTTPTLEVDAGWSYTISCQFSLDLSFVLCYKGVGKGMWIRGWAIVPRYFCISVVHGFFL